MGTHPTDRGTLGPTRSVLTAGHGRPLGSAVEGAHRHALTGVDATVEAIISKRPEPTVTPPPPRCLDPGSDADAVRATRDAWRDPAHMRHRGEAAPATRDSPGSRARRWVVARTHAWMNRVRRWRSRWEKTVEHDLAWLQVACAGMTFRAAARFGEALRRAPPAMD